MKFRKISFFLIQLFSKIKSLIKFHSLESCKFTVYLVSNNSIVVEHSTADLKVKGSTYALDKLIRIKGLV
jgi:hypothetical protein